jgi:Flp pilus assembly pilin Flp
VRLRVTIGDDRGAIATESCLTLPLIALVIITAATAFGIAVRGLFEQAHPAFTQAVRRRPPASTSV